MLGSDKVEEVAERSLKRIRAGHISNVKRKYDALQNCIGSTDKDVVKSASDAFNTAFREFISSHERYLEEEMDTEIYW